jgi:thiosulfate/3-mercaptopyruvate sulfurtransferase
MTRTLIHWLAIAAASCLSLMPIAAAAQARTSHLVSVDWLKERLGKEDLLLLDASSAKIHAAKHIPGAISADLMKAGMFNTTAAALERLFQAWGVTPGRKTVVYDEGGVYGATWVFHELVYHGFPAADLFVLDGGLSKWEATGGAVTKELSTAKPSTFRVARREEEQVRLNDFLKGSGDPKNHALVEALDATYHYGGSAFFGLAGHVPFAISLPVPDLFNADKTFKSPEELRRMASYLGIRPEQKIYSHCGGGLAATAPAFALKYVAGFPDVKVYKGSQLEWLQDERGLPFWTYDAPHMRRDAKWVSAWNNRMMRMYGVSQISVIDVRTPEAYAKGHVPFAVNIPAEVFRAHLDDPVKLAEVLGAAGVNPAHEAVISSGGGLNDRAALAYLALEKLGQKRVSIMTESMEELGMRGLPVTNEPTIVGAPKSPKDHAVAPAQYRSEPRTGITIADPRSTKGVYDKVFVASGKKLPEKAPEGKVVHVPYTDLLGTDGSPRPAHEIWNVLVKAGVPRYAEIIVYGQDPGEAAANYYVLKMMGFPDVKVLTM